MSVLVMAWVFANVTDITPAQKLLLLAIADEANDQGVQAFPGMARLASKTNQSVGGVRGQIATLEEAGHLVVSRPERQGRGHHNRYGIPMGRDPEPVLRAVSEGSTEVTLSDDEKGSTSMPLSAVKGPRKRAKGTPWSAHTHTHTSTVNSSSVHASREPRTETTRMFIPGTGWVDR